MQPDGMPSIAGMQRTHALCVVRSVDVVWVREAWLTGCVCYSASAGDVMMSHVVKEKYVGKVETRLPVLGVIVPHHTRLRYTATAALQHGEVTRSAK